MSPARKALVSNPNVHYDFMIGGPEVDVFGITKAGSEEAIVIQGEWELRW
jgi:leucyl aminopeptidase (aminopeptidase T)